jgi:inorganic pyrophosphatase
VDEIDDLPPHLLREIEHFFQIYKHLEGKPTATFGWRDRPFAENVIAIATGRYGQ